VLAILDIDIVPPVELSFILIGDPKPVFLTPRQAHLGSTNISTSLNTDSRVSIPPVRTNAKGIGEDYFVECRRVDTYVTIPIIKFRTDQEES